MYREWVHSELVMPRGGYQYAPGSITDSRILRFQGRRVRRGARGLKVINPYLGLTILGVIAFAIIVPLLKINADNSNSSIVVATQIPTLFNRSLAKHDNRHFLLGLTEHQKKEFTAQVHYIAEIIGKARTNKDPYGLAFQIALESKKAGQDPLFVSALIMAESSFRTQARSRKGALGLMQILPATGRYISKVQQVIWKGSSSLYDPAYNIKLGVAYLEYLKRQFRGNIHNALIAYNWGPTNLKDALHRRGKRIPYGSVRYSRRVQQHYATWRKDFRRKLPRYQYMHLNWARG